MPGVVKATRINVTDECPCLKGECLNSGVCTANVSLPVCVCPETFTGSRCETEREGRDRGLTDSTYKPPTGDVLSEIFLVWGAAFVVIVLQVGEEGKGDMGLTDGTCKLPTDDALTEPVLGWGCGTFSYALAGWGGGGQGPRRQYVQATNWRRFDRTCPGLGMRHL